MLVPRLVPRRAFEVSLGPQHALVTDHSGKELGRFRVDVPAILDAEDSMLRWSFLRWERNARLVPA